MTGGDAIALSLAFVGQITVYNGFTEKLSKVSAFLSLISAFIPSHAGIVQW